MVQSPHTENTTALVMWVTCTHDTSLRWTQLGRCNLQRNVRLPNTGFCSLILWLLLAFLSNSDNYTSMKLNCTKVKTIRLFWKTFSIKFHQSNSSQITILEQMDGQTWPSPCAFSLCMSHNKCTRMRLTGKKTLHFSLCALWYNHYKLD